MDVARLYGPALHRRRCDAGTDFTGKRVVVIGGGNVAMDVTRSSIRLGAERVTCVVPPPHRGGHDRSAGRGDGRYRRGCGDRRPPWPEVPWPSRGRRGWQCPWVQPQIIGDVDSSGRPKPNKAALEEVRIPADIIVVAIGQGIEIQGFEQAGVPIKRGTFVAGLSGQVGDMDNVFAGGDCVTGPATAIRAIAAGKVAAANIDEHLGFRHEIKVDLDIPAPRLNNRAPHGRINTTNARPASAGATLRISSAGSPRRARTGGVPLPAVRPLRLRHFPGREERKMVTLTIDGRTVSVPEGTTILEAARPAAPGSASPTLCYLKDINEIGACRICMVEVEGYDTAGALLRQRCQRGHGGVHQLTPVSARPGESICGCMLSQHETKCTSAPAAATANSSS